MTPNEINLMKTFTDLIEQKNEKIIELSVVEANNKVEEIKENWLEKYGKLQDELDQQEKKYNHLAERLKKDGYISSEVREELGMPDNSIKL